MKYNLVTTYLLPLLQIPVGKFKMAGNKTRLINAYLNDTTIEGSNENCIYIVVDSYQDRSFEEFDSFVKKHKDFVNDYEILDGLYIVYILTIPKYFREDYRLFMEGKYSRMSDEGQKLIIKCSYKSSAFLSNVFSKSKKLREAMEEKYKTSIDSDNELEEIVSTKISNLNVTILPRKKTFSQAIKLK